MHTSEHTIEAVAKKLLEITYVHSGRTPPDPDTPEEVKRGGFQSQVSINPSPMNEMQLPWKPYVEEAKELIRLLGSGE
ncbi:MAG: hypothetical protein RIS85_1534 [Pseudomonadota bacterium]